MLIKSLAGAALLLSVSLPHSITPEGEPVRTEAHKRMALEQATRSFVECVLYAASIDPHPLPAERVVNAILRSCPHRVVINAYDALHAAGGEEFFMGPFLDRLTELVGEMAKNQPTAAGR